MGIWSFRRQMYVISNFYFYLNLKSIISITIKNYASTAQVQNAVCAILSYTGQLKIQYLRILKRGRRR
jgi:hypothetical protein